MLKTRNNFDRAYFWTDPDDLACPKQQRPNCFSDHNWSSQIVVPNALNNLFVDIGVNAGHLTTDCQAVLNRVRLADVTLKMAASEDAFSISFRTAL